MVEAFCGISKEIWVGIFSVANVLVPGMILALFTAYYQTRKKREIKLEAAIFRVRIDSYERLMKAFGKLYHTSSPTLKDEEIIDELVGYFHYPDLNIDVSSCTSTESTFDSFYNDISKLQQNERIYLDEKTKDQLSNSVALFTHCKLFLDAFSDTENEMTHYTKTKEIQDRIDFAYLMTSIMMKSLYQSTLLKLEEVIGKQLRNINLLYGYHRLKHLCLKISECFLRILYRYMNNNKVLSLFGSIMSKENKMLTAIITQLPELYSYIHVKDKYKPTEFYNMEEQKRVALTKDFIQTYLGNLQQ